VKTAKNAPTPDAGGLLAWAEEVREVLVGIRQLHTKLMALGSMPQAEPEAALTFLAPLWLAVGAPADTEAIERDLARIGVYHRNHEEVIKHGARLLQRGIFEALLTALAGAPPAAKEAECLLFVKGDFRELIRQDGWVLGRPDELPAGHAGRDLVPADKLFRLGRHTGPRPGALVLGEDRGTDAPTIWKGADVRDLTIRLRAAQADEERRQQEAEKRRREDDIRRYNESDVGMRQRVSELEEQLASQK
jgi:hypothetical protein